MQVRIIPVLPQNPPFPLQRLSPSRSNLRVSASSTSSSDDVPPSHEASPIYNTAILQSLTPKPHLLSVHTLKESCPAFADALALLRVWANQRGYGTGSRLSVRGFEGKGIWWAELLKMLVVGEEATVGFGKSKGKRKPLGTGLSSYQMFKAALDFLGMCSTGISGRTTHNYGILQLHTIMRPRRCSSRARMVTESAASSTVIIYVSC